MMCAGLIGKGCFCGSEVPYGQTAVWEGFYKFVAGHLCNTLMTRESPWIMRNE